MRIGIACYFHYFAVEFNSTDCGCIFQLHLHIFFSADNNNNEYTHYIHTEKCMYI